MTENDTDDTVLWKGFECGSCGTTLVMFEQPEYCSGCGLPRNEGAGRSVAESNTNITVFKRHPIEMLSAGGDQDTRDFSEGQK